MLHKRGRLAEIVFRPVQGICPQELTEYNFRKIKEEETARHIMLLQELLDLPDILHPWTYEDINALD